MVGLWRQWRSSRTFELSPFQSARAIDTDIDMRRPTPRASTISSNLARALRWMMPQGNSIGPPMRSVAREQEEFFPSDDH